MLLELSPEQERVVDMALKSGAYTTSGEVINTALSLLAEDIEDGAISESRKHEQRFSLDEVEAELRSLGKI